MASSINKDVEESADLQPIVLVEKMQEHPTPPTQGGSPSSSQNTIISTMNGDNHHIDPETLNQKLLETSIEQNRSRELEALDAQHSMMEQSIKTKKNEVNRKADLQIAQSRANLMLSRNATLNNLAQMQSQHKIEPAGSYQTS